MIKFTPEQEKEFDMSLEGRLEMSKAARQSYLETRQIKGKAKHQEVMVFEMHKEGYVDVLIDAFDTLTRRINWLERKLEKLEAEQLAELGDGK